MPARASAVAAETSGAFDELEEPWLLSSVSFPCRVTNYRAGGRISAPAWWKTGDRRFFLLEHGYGRRTAFPEHEVFLQVGNFS
jgi:hypothetical protein